MDIYNEASDNEVLEFVKDSMLKPDDIKAKEKPD